MGFLKKKKASFKVENFIQHYQGKPREVMNILLKNIREDSDFSYDRILNNLKELIFRVNQGEFEDNLNKEEIIFLVRAYLDFIPSEIRKQIKEDDYK